MIKTSRIVIVIIGTLLTSGCLALVITHASLSCTSTEDNQTSDCTDLIFQANPGFTCPGPLTATDYEDTYTVEIICPWGKTTSILSYISFALAIIFFGLYLQNKDRISSTQIIGGLSSLLLFTSLILMLIETYQGSSFSVGSSSNVTTSETPFFWNCIVAFITFGWLLLMLKQVREQFKKVSSSESLLNSGKTYIFFN